MEFDFKISGDKNRDLKIIEGIIYKRASINISNIQRTLNNDESLEQKLKELKQILIKEIKKEFGIDKELKELILQLMLEENNCMKAEIYKKIMEKFLMINYKIIFY